MVLTGVFQSFSNFWTSGRHPNFIRPADNEKKVKTDDQIHR